jgi:5'-nucleotidase
VSTAAGVKTIGIIGATTETLSFVSSTGAVVVNPVAAAVNAQIANLKAAGADHIVLAGHLQGLGTDNALVGSLDPGIDLIIAGGGDELLRNDAAVSPGTIHAGAPASVADTGFIPGDSPATLSGSLTGVANNYPVMSTVTDSGGRNIPLVTTGGNYGYLGRMTLNFDSSGQLTGFDESSGPQRVASTVADANHGVASDPGVLADSVAPVQSFVAGLAANDLANTSVQFLHGGSPTIRSRETNLGNLVADGLLSAAREQADAFGVDSPQIALVNGGGIRANIDAGDVTQLNTFSVSPFGNFVAVVEDVKLADLKLLLENAYSRVTDNPALPGGNPVSSDGRFAQIAGMEVVYDLSLPGFTFNADGSVITAPERVRDIVIDGTPYLVDGVWQLDPAEATVDIATLNFSAGGGDQWFRTAIGGTSTYLSQIYDFTAVGLTDQNALQRYIEAMANGDSSFDISTFKPEYAVAQSTQGGRISAVPEPAALTLVVVGGLGFWLPRQLISRRAKTA